MKAKSDQFSYPLGDRLQAAGDTSEAAASSMSAGSAAAQFGGQLSIHIGVGAQ
jgi:hypothetical protein